ncbi:cadherin-like protein 26 isoform 2-T2 [Anomaloglossus baeobatrachus]|uniref:cadherin-like protein 26 isoform X2 n=1 Tax=Anomaloglossus baeobatrachus TaxID=238106 RepID=UPI003F5003F8
MQLPASHLLVRTDQERQHEILLVLLSGVCQCESSSRTRTHIINKRLQRRMAQSRQKRDWIIDTFTLQEELPGPYPKLIGTVKLEEEAQLVYKLQGKGVDEEPKGLFHINEDTGAIYVHQAIDYEDTPLFQWKFNAINKTSMKVGTRLGIHLKILDINDNAPEFKNKTFYVSVNETTLQGYTVYSLLAYDKDEENTPNSIVSYYLKSQIPKDPNAEFTIHKDKGFISFKGCLKYETNQFYKLVVEAEDSSMEERQTSTCEVHISVLDRNTIPPILSERGIRGEVLERDVNVTILRIGIVDGDTPYTPGWRAKYSIVEGDDNEHFAISTDPKTNEGLLRVIKPLDYEESTTSNLMISVENEEPIYTCKIVKKQTTGLWDVDAGKIQPRLAKEKTSILVDVIDRNDAPIFKPQTILVTSEEHYIKPGTVLVTLEAKDPDIVAANKIKYFLANDSADWLSVHEDTGVITTKGELDRESNYVMSSKYIVEILAVDDGAPAMTGTATLIINLKDINDNAPKLHTPFITTCEKDEEVILSTPIIDKDIKPYSGPFYVNVADKEPEKLPIKMIDYNDDILKIKKEKDAPQGNYTLHLEIYDLQGMASLENITVYVCNCLGGDVCLEKIADPPTLSGSAIALILLAPIFFLLLCLLLCKIETKKVMVPVETEALNSLITYNEESDNKDCLASEVLNGVGNIADVTGNDQEEFDSLAFRRSSTRRSSAPAAVINNKTRVGRSNSIQVHSANNQNRVGAAPVSFDRSNKRRHSSYHTGRKQSFERVNTLRVQHANATHRTFATSHSSLQRKFSRTLETTLTKKLHAQMNAHDMYKPRVYAEEGELSHSSSLESISISSSVDNLSNLHSFGSKFNVLENICEDHIMKVPTTTDL